MMVCLVKENDDVSLKIIPGTDNFPRYFREIILFSASGRPKARSFQSLFVAVFGLIFRNFTISQFRIFDSRALTRRLDPKGNSTDLSSTVLLV
jgi:hypothetical protein